MTWKLGLQQPHRQIVLPPSWQEIPEAQVPEVLFAHPASLTIKLLITLSGHFWIYERTLSICLIRNLFFLLQLIRSLPFRGLYCVRGTDRKGKEWVFCISVFLFSLLNKSVFSISLFYCIGFSNIGQIRLWFTWKAGVASALLLLWVCYAIKRHFAGKSLSPAETRPQSRL